jgi:hypothetical protein
MSMADYPNPLNTKLDANQVLIRSYDEPNNRLRVDAQVTSSIGTVDVVIDAASGDNIKISDGVDTLSINPDGSINVNITDLTILHTNDSVALGNGVDKLVTVTTVGPKNGLDVNVINSTPNNLNDGYGNPITSTTLGSNQVLHTLTPDSVSSVGTFNSLNSNISLEVTGLVSIGFQLNAGTFKGILYAQSSVDGGANWANVNFYDPANSTVLPYLEFTGSSHAVKIVSITPIGGSSHVRVIALNYTSGTSAGIIRASNVTGAVGSITASAFNTISNQYITLTANTPTLLLSSNPNRKFAYISNNSGATLNIQFGTGTGLTAQKGLVVKSQDSYQLQGTNLYTGDIYGFSSTAITISITEGTP